MSDSDLERKIGLLSARIESLFFGIKAFLLLVLLAGSFGNFAAVLSIGKYQKIFNDALPGHALPYLTMMVLEGKTLLFILVFVWPIVGVVAAFIRQKITLSLLLFCAALVGISLQYGIVILAMELPMTGLLQGLSDPNP